MLSDPRGRTRRGRCVSAPVESTWRSLRTFVEYPVAMTFTCEELDLELRVEALQRDQEVVTFLSAPSFWAGQVKVSGTVAGAPARGRGWVELRGYGHRRPKALLASIGSEVAAVVGELLPRQPGDARLGALVTGGGGARPRDGFDREAYTARLIAPIRDIVDRGGKAWRSFGLFGCIELVGGDPRRFRQWLAMPELLHSGSLIVDDVEDRSTVRRGGPACHLLHGEAIAVNAGCAAYFVAEPPIHETDLPDRDKLRIYRLFFECMRAGHAGQALDLAGAPAGGYDEPERLKERLLAVHHLKSAVPAASWARIGAVLGGGTDAQVAAVGEFFEALGLAFQIVDDVLDLRGFGGNLKTRGDDVMHGKLTLPILEAMCSLPLDERRRLAAAILAQPTETEEVGRILALVEATGANDRSMKLARDLVEDAWARLDSTIEDSQAKVLMRAFSWYLLERHY